MIVECYWNLHKHVYSVRHKGKVIGHFPTVVLQDAEYRVSEAGRKRVLKEQVKNVHAYILGRLSSHDLEFFKKDKQVTYNPYKYETFVDCISKTPILYSEYALLTSVESESDTYPKVFTAVLTPSD